MKLTPREKDLLADAIQTTIKEIEKFLPKATTPSRYRLEETKRTYERLTQKISTHEKPTP